MVPLILMIFLKSSFDLQCNFLILTEFKFLKTSDFLKNQSQKAAYVDSFGY